MKLKTKNIFKIMLAIFFAIYLILAGFWLLNLKSYKKVEIKSQKFFVETALSPKEQGVGLGGREKIKENEGLLFYFAKDGEYSFWMKDMKFNLDIIWIKDDKIAYIAKNISCNSLEKINPHISTDKVLEINGGLSDKYGFKVGDSVEIHPASFFEKISNKF